MGLNDDLGKAVSIHCETMVHRNDLNLARRQILYRMIGTVMALFHLDRRGPQRQGQHLVTQADAKDWQS